MAVDVYVNFNGTCREAVEFYAKIFKTEKPHFMTFGESPQNSDYPLPENAKELIMHTRLNILGSNVMFSDAFPGHEVTVGNNVNLAVVSEDEELIRSAFNALKEGGHISMELQETFWSKCYGSLRDKFGVEWLFSHENEEQ